MTSTARARQPALLLALLLAAAGGGCAHLAGGNNPFAEEQPVEPTRNWFGDRPALEDREDLVDALVSDAVDEADQLLQEGRFRAAELLLEEALAGMPEDWTPRREVRDTIEYAAWDLEEFVRAQREEPFNNGDRLVWTQPSYSRAWYLMARVAQHQRDAERALRCLERADELEPEHPRVLNELGIAMLSQGRPEEALTYFNDALVVRSWARDEVRGRSLRGAAAALAQMDRLAQAADLLVRSLTVQPGHHDAEAALMRIRALQEDQPMDAELRALMADALDLPETDDSAADEDLR